MLSVQVGRIYPNVLHVFESLGEFCEVIYGNT